MIISRFRERETTTFDFKDTPEFVVCTKCTDFANDPALCGKCIKTYSACDKLSAYEDSGLCPEEVAYLAMADREGRLKIIPEFGNIEVVKFPPKYV